MYKIDSRCLNCDGDGRQKADDKCSQTCYTADRILTGQVRKGVKMDGRMLRSILQVGETVAVEFKRCGNGIEHDVYETVCSFLNRFGGDIFMGVLDDGTVVGVPPRAAPDMVGNFISVVSNPRLFSPTVYLSPEILTDEAGHTVIHVHIPPGAEVYSYKRVVYDRVDDADVKVTATGQIAAMYIRKQNIFTEKRIYPYVSEEDLRLGLLPGLRTMAVNNAAGDHPWKYMDDGQLLKSAGLYSLDRVTGQRGYNLAAVMLLGKDDVILDISPAYVTDALVRKVNTDRYDDREIVKTNLVDSYKLLMEFARKNLQDKFFLEGDQRKSLRNIIAREMLVNTLIHREMTSSYIAKFVIEKDKMYVENANRAAGDGVITPENLEPNPKNPVIASFFRNIGYADQLGSGVRNLFKYTKYYSGKEPEFKEGDIFRITVPLDDGYSFGFKKEDSEIGFIVPVEMDEIRKNADKVPINADKKWVNAEIWQEISREAALTRQQQRILAYVIYLGEITSREAEKICGVKQRRARDILKELVNKNVLFKQGSYRSTVYKLSKRWNMEHVKEL